MIELKIGGVYRIDRRKNYDGFGPIELWDTIERVLCYDEFEVISDIDLSKGTDEWVMNKRDKKRCFFGRRPKSFYENYGERIGFSEVPPESVKFYRLDLPLRISRIKNLSWFDPVFDNINEFAAFILDNTSSQWQNQRLEINELYINAGPESGGLIRLKADNGNWFSAAEMLWKGKQAIKPKYKDWQGVGIFRSGSKSGIPVYYVGEYYDRAGFLKKYEDAGIETNV